MHTLAKCQECQRVTATLIVQEIADKVPLSSILSINTLSPNPQLTQEVTEKPMYYFDIEFSADSKQAPWLLRAYSVVCSMHKQQLSQ